MRRRAKFEIISLITLGMMGAGGASVGALSYQSNVGVGFTFNPTLTVSLSNSDLVISNLSPGARSDSNIITVGVSTNAAYGYDLLATVGNASNATTELKNGNNSFTSLSSNTATLASFDDNKWGYSYSTDSGTSWVSGDQGSTSTGYAGLPLYTGTGVKMASANSNTDSSVQFKIAAKAGATQASGEYTNVVNFAAVSKVGVVTLLDAFVASNATQQNGYYTMQGMTPAICNMADKGSSIQLMDTRDGKMYWATKLEDGNCWMTQNLDLDIVAGSTNFTSNNTDLSTNNSVYTASNTIYTLKGAGDTYGYTYENGVATWIPERTTIAYDQLNSTSWLDSDVYPYSYDRLDTTAGANNGQPVKPDSNVTDSHGLSGNYYNWTASIASNDSNNASSANPDQTNSICPKGWRLPSATNKEFGNLLVQYGIISTNTSTSYIENQSSVNSMGAAPLYLVRGGRILGGSLYGSGGGGRYWSSTLYGTSYAFRLYFSSDNVDPQNGDSRGNGFSVRCVARSV